MRSPRKSVTETRMSAARRGSVSAEYPGTPVVALQSFIRQCIDRREILYQGGMKVVKLYGKMRSAAEEEKTIENEDGMGKRSFTAPPRNSKGEQK